MTGKRLGSSAPNPAVDAFIFVLLCIVVGGEWGGSYLSVMSQVFFIVLIKHMSNNSYICNDRSLLLQRNDAGRGQDLSQGMREGRRANLSQGLPQKDHSFVSALNLHPLSLCLCVML